MGFYRSYFYYLIYISIIFLILTLFRADYLIIPDIKSIMSLIISFILLFIGFFMQALNWKQILKNDMPISMTEAIASVGLTVFTKYIPGKVLVIIGKVAYISTRYDNYSKLKLTKKAFYAQIIVLWLGMLFGSFLFFQSNSFYSYRVYFLLCLIFSTLIVFTNFIQDWLKLIYLKFFNKELYIKALTLNSLINVLPSFIAYMIIFSLSFYFFIDSISDDYVPIWLGTSFVLAFVIGIISIVMPGGVGIREGILYLLLVNYGLDIKTSTFISVFSRPWFLTGELFFFICGKFADNRLQKKKS